MRLALDCARRARGRTAPNPPVGAVVYRGDQVLGRGYTRPPGGAHAERVALERALRRHGAARVRGASLAVTLEPCSHHGRTPPCADAVIAAGIARVIAGHADPHAAVRGRGLARLRRAGVAVEVGVCEADCREQHRGFLSVQERRRPFVSLKLAATLDARIATSRGESRWITGSAARAAVHRLRAGADAIAVGSQTAIADDPSLDSRRGAQVIARPARVLFDSQLRVAPSARLYRDDGARRLAVCTRSAAAARGRALEAQGVELVVVPSRGRRADLALALRALARAGVCELFVEGGGGLAAALIARGLVDELHWFAAPRVLGADARPAVAALGIGRLSRAPRFAWRTARRVGDDVWLTARALRGLRGGGRS
jgi:diaminohydroxyphosphoribosylaminopyrimidine deaminase/5-amino-6-(5-phosphoribosylamino)uracil reductase